MKPGDVLVEVTTGRLIYDDGIKRALSPKYYPARTISQPSSTENRFLFIAFTSLVILSAKSVLVGSSTPSITWNIRHGLDRSTSLSDVFDANLTTTSTTTVETDTNVLGSAINVGESVWLVTTAKSGTVDELCFALEVLELY